MHSFKEDMGKEGKVRGEWERKHEGKGFIGKHQWHMAPKVEQAS